MSRQDLHKDFYEVLINEMKSNKYNKIMDLSPSESVARIAGEYSKIIKRVLSK